MSLNFVKYARKLFESISVVFRKGSVVMIENCMIFNCNDWKIESISWEAFDCIDHELLIAKLNAYGFVN